MSIRHHFDADTGTLFVSVEGAPSDEEVLLYAKRLAEDPALPAGRRELIDLRLFDNHRVSAHTLRAMADAFRAREQHPERTRVAFVTSTDWAFGLSRMYQAYRDGSPTQVCVFRDVAEARRWLGLPDA